MANTTTKTTGVTKGALAGAIVGSIIGTAILAFLAAWLFIRRSQSSKRGGFQRYGKEDNNTAAINKSDQSSRFLPAEANKNNQNFSDGASENLLLSSRSLSKYIPDPADDESVIGRVLGLFDQVSLHVDNYYSHTQPVASPSSPAESARISQFDSSSLPKSLSALLENPKTRRTTITHTLARSLLSAIQPQSATRGSLLPPLFTPGPLASDDQELNQATYTWRILTAYLSRNATLEATEETQLRQEAAINAFVENFTSSFAPYADPSLSPEDGARHLRSVTTAAADLGRWLFGQPCAFDFVYPEATGNNEVVVLPAIVKVLDEKGQRLATKATLYQAVTANF